MMDKIIKILTLIVLPLDVIVLVHQVLSILAQYAK